MNARRFRFGTKRTNRAGRLMSVYRGRPEVIVPTTKTTRMTLAV